MGTRSTVAAARMHLDTACDTRMAYSVSTWMRHVPNTDVTMISLGGVTGPPAPPGRRCDDMGENVILKSS